MKTNKPTVIKRDYHGYDNDTQYKKSINLKTRARDILV